MLDNALYFGYADANPKVSTADKIADALARYQARYGHRPTVVLCSPGDIIPYPSVVLKPAEHLRPGTFWLALESE